MVTPNQERSTGFSENERAAENAAQCDVKPDNLHIEL